MQEKEDSNSDNSTISTVITSKLRPKYICKQCFKGFNNGHALGGHQNAHRSEKSLSSSSTQNNNNNDNSHLPFLDNGYNVITKPIAEGFGGVRVVQTSRFNGNNEDDEAISRSTCVTRGGVVKDKSIANESPRYHPYYYDKTTENQVINVSMKAGFQIISSNRNGELEPKLKKNEDLDLELKLGFY